MYALCAQCRTPHKLPETSDLGGHACDHCSGQLIDAEAVLCRACLDAADGFTGRIHFIAKGARSWICPRGHHNQRVRRPGASVWTTLKR